VIDRITNTVVATIPVGTNPAVIAFMSSAAPKTKDDCRNGGYKKFMPPVGPFKNQGQCIKFINKSP
jgi:DNA-binding beta-propeller fold protein YncE